VLDHVRPIVSCLLPAPLHIASPVAGAARAPEPFSPLIGPKTIALLPEASLAEYDGHDAISLFGRGQSLTYDDVILLPGRIEFATSDITLDSRVTRRYKLKTPFISSPMDTVTESGTKEVAHAMWLFVLRHINPSAHAQRPALLISLLD
jgi:hypothetical protein